MPLDHWYFFLSFPKLNKYKGNIKIVLIYSTNINLIATYTSFNIHNVIYTTYKTLSDKLENANYYVLRTLFNLPKSISYEQILLQYNLDSIKHRRMVQALTLVYKSYPNYISNMFRIKNCVYNLRGNGSRLDQPAPNTGFKHRSFSYIACRLWNKIPLHVREAPNLKNFMAKLKKLKLSQDECRCNFCSN